MASRPTSLGYPPGVPFHHDRGRPAKGDRPVRTSPSRGGRPAEGERPGRDSVFVVVGSGTVVELAQPTSRPVAWPTTWPATASCPTPAPSGSGTSMPSSVTWRDVGVRMRSGPEIRSRLTPPTASTPSTTSRPRPSPVTPNVIAPLEGLAAPGGDGTVQIPIQGSHLLAGGPGGSATSLLAPRAHSPSPSTDPTPPPPEAPVTSPTFDIQSLLP